MIALNELLDRIDEYKDVYKKLGLKCDLDIFVTLENERKANQLLCEKLRAECNKKCGEVATLKMNGEDCSLLIKEIVRLDEEANSLKVKLDHQARVINRKLRRLRNIPRELLYQSETILTQENSGTMSDKCLYFQENCEQYNGKIKTYLKAQKNILFMEDELPKIVCCRDGNILLDKDFDIDEDFRKLIDYFKPSSSCVVRVCSKETEKFSADEYLFKYVDGTIKLELAGEFFTREFSIKYRNKSIDATKFVNQINIKKR